MLDKLNKVTYKEKCSNVFRWNETSNWTEAFQLRFSGTFGFFLKRGTGSNNLWKQDDKFRSDRIDRLERTTFGGEAFFRNLVRRGPKHSISVSTKRSEDFGIIEGTPWLS